MGSPKATRRSTRRLPVPDPLGPPAPKTRNSSLTIFKLLKDHTQGPAGSVRLTRSRTAPLPRDRASSDDSDLGLRRTPRVPEPAGYGPVKTEPEWRRTWGLN